MGNSNSDSSVPEVISGPTIPDGPAFGGAKWLTYNNLMVDGPVEAWMRYENDQCYFTFDEDCVEPECSGTCEIEDESITWTFAATNVTVSQSFEFEKGAGCWGPFKPQTDELYAYQPPSNANSTEQAPIDTFWLW